MIFPLVGNEKIKQSVDNSVRENRIPHAIIIEGDKGTGRHTLADFLSRAAVCDEESKPCGVCKNCHLADINSHPDIMIVAPEEGKKNIAVSQIRTLKNETFVKPHQAKNRVFIIDFADTMNEQSQNALLKVLEEPPGNIIFVLIAESKSALLETIISRCVILTLNVPPKEKAIELIKSKGNFSDIDISNTLDETGCNIGRTFDLLLGIGDTKTSVAAKEYIESLIRLDEWGCLLAIAPFEKKRVEADRFFKDIKIHIANMIKKNPSGQKAKNLSSFYSRVSFYEKSLVTNVNLGLLFSAVTADGIKIFR